jgi:hypothetical protein
MPEAWRHEPDRKSGSLFNDSDLEWLLRDLFLPAFAAIRSAGQPVVQSGFNK